MYDHYYHRVITIYVQLRPMRPSLNCVADQCLPGRSAALIASVDAVVYAEPYQCARAPPRGDCIPRATTHRPPTGFPPGHQTANPAAKTTQLTSSIALQSTQEPNCHLQMSLLSWFSRPAPADAQTGGHEPVVPSTSVLEQRDLDDFTAVDVRPLTYAEASEQRIPAANRRELGVKPYSSIDDAQLAVQAVDEYVRQCEQQSRPVATHVAANIEYWGDSSGEIARPRSKRTRRRSTKSEAAHARREAARARDKLRNQCRLAA